MDSDSRRLHKHRMITVITTLSSADLHKDVIGVILSFMEPLFHQYIVDDAILHGWILTRPRFVEYGIHEELHPPYSFACKSWSSRHPFVRYNYSEIRLPEFVYDNAVRRTGTWRPSSEDDDDDEEEEEEEWY